MQPIEVEDDGVVTVTVGGASVAVDLYETHDALAELGRRFKDDSGGYWAALRAYLEGLGLPRLSALAADRVCRAVFARVDDLRGKDRAPASSGTPGSAGSTGAGSAG